MKKVKENFQAPGMIIVTILSLIGAVIIIGPLTAAIKHGASFMEILSEGLVFFLFGGFFFLIGLYCWIMYIRNIIIKPEIETLYLLEKNKDTGYIFINKKGKKIYYENRKELEANKFYVVNKTKDYIIKVLEESQNEFKIIIKDSFWLNWYSPYGHIENVLLLPILYLITSIFLIPAILTSIPNNIILLFISIYPQYYIIYDLIIKKKKRIKNKELEEKLNKSSK